MVGSELSLSSLVSLSHMNADTTLAVKDILPSLHHMALHSQRYQECYCTRKYIGNHQRPVRRYSHRQQHSGLAANLVSNPQSHPLELAESLPLRPV